MVSGKLGDKIILVLGKPGENPILVSGKPTEKHNWSWFLANGEKLKKKC